MRRLAGTSSVWQLVQRGSLAALVPPSFLMMPLPVSLFSASYAAACLSFSCQVLNSLAAGLGAGLGAAAPWQLALLHPAAPSNLNPSDTSWADGCCLTSAPLTHEPTVTTRSPAAATETATNLALTRDVFRPMFN